MPALGIRLLDANVWLAIAVGTHAHHVRAKAWFDAQPDNSCGFCRITQMALLRHLTNSRIMGAAVQTQANAWRTFDALAADPRVVFLGEPVGAGERFKGLTQQDYPGHQLWTDAYLAAFAEGASAGIVTFDAGFRGASGLSIELLPPS